MKYLTILFLILFLGCHTSDDETLLFLNEGVERCNEFLENSASDYYSMMVAASHENSQYVNPIKGKTDSIKLFSDSLTNIVNSIYQSIILENDTAKNKRCLLKSKDVSNDGLKEAIEKYSQYIVCLNEADSFYSENDLAKSLCFDNSKLEYNIAALNRIINKTLVTNYKTLLFYFKKIDEKSVWFSQIMPVVIPKKRYVKTGEMFNAKIFLAEVDTVLDMQLTLPNDPLFSITGVFKIKEEPKRVGKHIKAAVIELENPKTHEIMKFPCKIEYLVTK